MIPWQASLRRAPFLSTQGRVHAIECGTIDIEIKGGTANCGYAVVLALLTADQSSKGLILRHQLDDART